MTTSSKLFQVLSKLMPESTGEGPARCIVEGGRWPRVEIAVGDEIKVSGRVCGVVGGSSTTWRGLTMSTLLNVIGIVQGIEPGHCKIRIKNDRDEKQWHLIPNGASVANTDQGMVISWPSRSVPGQTAILRTTS